MDAQRTKHVTYKLAYHFVWCPKYRKGILTGRIAAFVEQEIHRICEINTWTIGALNVREDHVHLFLSASPSAAPSQIAHILKGTAACRVCQHFPAVKKQLWGGAFWSRSYYLGRVGDISQEESKRCQQSLDSPCRILATGEPSVKRKESLSHGTTTSPVGDDHPTPRQ